MALPGVHARAAAPGENPWGVEATHLEYSESGSRMNVRVNQVSAAVPIGETFQLRGNFIQDLMSGASPVFNAPGPGGKPQQVLTGASVFDNRKAGDIGASASFGDNFVTLRQGWSKENDYRSTWTSLEGKRDFNQKSTTLGAGVAFSDDGVSSHDAPDDFRTRIKRDFFAGVTQLIDERSLVALSLEYSYSTGFLSDPYKLVFVQSGGLLPDSRPDRRRQTAATLKYLAYVPGIDAALQATGSLSSDNWGIHSGALELQWKKELPAEWLVNAGTRLYTQSSANFYAPLYVTPPEDAHSSDYRLAGFGSIAWLAGVTKQLTPNFSVQLAAERTYRRAGLRSGGTGIDADD
ncbi:MAG TPA: DUF3570 domain-containing protein, partial [Casimicrobiaceae bacterium]|nr:DUF3570 domain-containing protein [Casimicrobiaceae bacterium]